MRWLFRAPNGYRDYPRRIDVAVCWLFWVAFVGWLFRAANDGDYIAIGVGLGLVIGCLLSARG